MAINLVTQFSEKVLERFHHKSYTAGAASKDWAFDGIKSLKIFSVGTSPLNNYTRSGTSRYGTVEDLQDNTQTLTINNDKSFTYAIDKGDNKQQLNIKSANRSLTREIDEVITPYLDKYNFEVWCRKAGSHVTDGGTAVNKNSIVEKVMDCTEALDEVPAPESGRTMWIKNSFYKILKQNPEFLNVDKLAEKALVRGEVGRIDDMRVVKVPNSYLPAGVDWLITHQSAILAPMQLKDYKIHVDPPGINGDLVEGRFIHDAFVLGEKSKAVCVMLNNSYATNKPVITKDATNNKYNVAGATGTVLFYTVDGSDPGMSDTATNAGANTATVNYNAIIGGAQLRVIAVPTNNAKFRSDEADQPA